MGEFESCIANIIKMDRKAFSFGEAAEKVHLERNVYSKWTFIFISFITLAYIGNTAIEKSKFLDLLIKKMI